ncbi:hypothetical protein K432DRAFT_438525 [Lepidopterella palustris CBS 459.81]|uniref:Uncharacterized protein n=1 Tax=Lepidopterella palustris CBS 459.81 TaxID=1314670 RepID=A0A8E2ELX8_9PEZI|nr:hypothetical protein K432DRAFT_438525 [Lepidopterella palustris CBS 459.81]
MTAQNPDHADSEIETMSQSHNQPDVASARNASSFKFVNISTTPRISKDSKSLIKAQVMKNFHRRKLKRKMSDENEADSPHSSAMVTANIANHMNKFRLGPWGLQQRPTPPRAPRRKGEPRKSASKGQWITESDKGTEYSVKAADTDNIFQLEVFGEQNDAPQTPKGLIDFLEYDTAVLDAIMEAVADEANEDIQFTISGLPINENFKYGVAVPEVEQDSIVRWFTDPGNGGYTDPFNSIPKFGSDRAQFVLHFSYSNFTRPSFMMNLKIEWLSMATEDEAYFHALISHFTSHFSLMHQRGDPLEALMHRIEAVKLVNARLGDPGMEASDGTISTVACIANYEALNGNLVSVQVHMNGLESMVKMRGGLDTGDFPTYVHRKIAWADVNSATALGRDPVLPPIQQPKISHLLAESAGFAMCQMDLQPLGKDVAEVFASLRHLSRVLILSSTTELRTLDALWWSDWIYWVKRTLVTLSNVKGDKEKQLVSCIAIAGHTIFEVCLRGISLNNRIIDRLVSRQKDALEKMLPKVTIDPAHPTRSLSVLWSLFASATAATTRPECSWYVDKLVEVCNLLDLHNWEDVEAVLEDVWWHSSWKLPYQTLWDEVKAARVAAAGLGT